MIPEYSSCFKDKQLSIYQQQLYHYHKPSVAKELLCYHYISIRPTYFFKISYPYVSYRITLKLNLMSIFLIDLVL